MTDALTASHVTVTRGDRAIVEDASLTLAPGEVTILLGPNGAGKTTLARAMAGLIAASGQITFGTESVHAMPPRSRAKAIAYLPQGHEFHWPMSVARIVALGREPHADPFARLSGADRLAVEDAMKATSVDHLASRVVTTLSGGEQARVAIARALATQAKVLIADEPTMSLDQKHQLTTMSLLRQVAASGTAVLAIIHDLALAMRFADNVAVMKEGRVVACGKPLHTLTDQMMADVFGVTVHRVETPDGPLLVPMKAV